MPRYVSLFARLLAHSVESETYSYRECACWEWTGAKRARGDYGRITVRVPGRPKPVRRAVHRVMAELALGRPLTLEEAPTIQHGCDIPWCINYWHFEVATRSENTSDMRAKLLGRPRRAFKPLLDPELYSFDPFVRALPRLKSAVVVPDLQEIPF